MSMDKLISEVAQLVEEEYGRAGAKFGLTNHSNHESYAVLMEEVEEAADEHTMIDRDLPYLWNLIKRNAPSDDICNTCRHIQTHALLAACEFIQVAAMAKKAQITVCERRAIKECTEEEGDSK